MKRLLLVVFALALSIAADRQLAVAQQESGAAATVRFAAIDVFVDSAEPLAAWQFELSERTGAMVVVGVENGDSEAFPEAPHFDLAAVEQDRADRIIVADFSLADADRLPSGRTRVATVHVRLADGRAPDFDLQLIAAGNSAGQPVTAEAVFELQDGSEP